MDTVSMILGTYVCKLEGCTRAAHVDYERGAVYDYCSYEHARLHNVYSDDSDLSSRDESNEDALDRDQLLALQAQIGNVCVGLPQSYLDTLPTYVLCDDEDTPCAICMDELCAGQDVRYLPCVHIYHKACIDQWLTSDSLNAKNCPACMTNVRDQI